MNSQVQITAIIASVAVMLLVFHLIRQRKLREEYALLWFAAGLGLIIVSIWRDLLHYAARLLGVAYPPSVLLLGVIGVGFLLAMHYSISLSRLVEQNKRLAQEVALLRHQLDQTNRRLDRRPDETNQALNSSSKNIHRPQAI